MTRFVAKSGLHDVIAGDHDRREIRVSQEALPLRKEVSHAVERSHSRQVLAPHPQP